MRWAPLKSHMGSMAWLLLQRQSLKLVQNLKEGWWKGRERRNKALDSMTLIEWDGPNKYREELLVMHVEKGLWNWYKRDFEWRKEKNKYSNLLFLYEKGNSDKANSGIWDFHSRPIIDTSLPHFTGYVILFPATHYSMLLDLSYRHYFLTGHTLHLWLQFSCSFALCRFWFTL